MAFGWWEPKPAEPEVKISLTSAEVCLPTPEARMEGCSSRGRCDGQLQVKKNESWNWKFIVSPPFNWLKIINLYFNFDYFRAMFQFDLRLLFTWLGVEKNYQQLNMYMFSVFGDGIKGTFWDISLFTPCFLISQWPTWFIGFYRSKPKDYNILRVTQLSLNIEDCKYITQMLNVWPIYLHLGSFGGKCR